MNSTEHKTNETATKIPPWEASNNYGSGGGVLFLFLFFFFLGGGVGRVG